MAHLSSGLPRLARFWLRLWLLGLAVLVYAMILIGGATRLTDSGLAITEWKPVTGILPPLSERDWRAEFAKYATTTEYRQQNHAMNLAEFKTIYWWEWGHRFFGRMIGLVFLIPFGIFGWLGWIGKPLLYRLIALFALGGTQAIAGWWMVASGLEASRIDVAPYRLMIHFSLALAIIGLCVWSWREFAPRRPLPPGAAHWARLLFALLILQMMFGALTAGLDAGRTYTDWPLMDGTIVPTSIWELSPPVRNLFANPATVQFAHRLGAYLLFALACIAALRARRHAFTAFAGLVTLQGLLGVVTLVLAAPLFLGLAHQAVSVLLFLAGLDLVFRTRLSQAALICDSDSDSASTR